MTDILKYPRIGARMRYEEIEKRYPRLIRAMQWAAILSVTEARECIQAIQERRGSGEAVSHFGGPLAVLEAGIRCRHFAASNHRERERQRLAL